MNTVSIAKSRKTAVLSARTISMTAMLSAVAYLLALAEFLPFIRTKLDVVLFNAFPFNLLKGLVIGGVTMLTYKRLTPVLKGSRRNHRGGLSHEKK